MSKTNSFWAALDYLARALEIKPGDRAWAARDPDLAALHGVPRFRARVAEQELLDDDVS